MTLEDTIRQALREKASEGRADLAFAGSKGGVADRAMAGAGHRARRRAALATLAAVAVLAVVGTAALTVSASRRGDGHHTPILAAVPAAELLPDAVTVAAYPATPHGSAERWLVADPTTGMYRDVKGRVVAASPDQRYAVIWAVKALVDGRDADRSFAIYDVTADRTLRTLTFPASTMTPLWSPDGRWLAFPHARGANRGDQVTEAVSFVDLITGKVSTVDVDSDGAYEVEAALAWVGDSSGLLFAASGDKADRLLFARMARDGTLSRGETDWSSKQWWSRAGVTVTVPARVIHMASAGDRSRFDVIDLATRRLQNRYESVAVARGGAWLDGEHYATVNGAQVLLHDARRGDATTATLTLPSPAADLPLFAPAAKGAKTLSISLG